MLDGALVAADPGEAARDPARTERDRQERHGEAGGVCDEEHGALRDAAVAEARPMIRPRIGPMQGLQPAANAVPKRSERV